MVFFGPAQPLGLSQVDWGCSLYVQLRVFCDNIYINIQYIYIRVYISYMSQTHATLHCYNDMDFMFITFLWRYHNTNHRENLPNSDRPPPNILNICRSRFTNKPPDTSSSRQPFALQPFFWGHKGLLDHNVQQLVFEANLSGLTFFYVQNPCRNFLKQMAKKGSRSLFFHFSWNEVIFFSKIWPMKGKMCPWKGKMRPWKGTSTMWKLGIWHLLLRFWCSAFALWGYSQIRSLFHPSTCRRGEPFSLLLKFKKIRSCWFLVANLGYSPFSRFSPSCIIRCLPLCL